MRYRDEIPILKDKDKKTKNIITDTQNTVLSNFHLQSISCIDFNIISNFIFKSNWDFFCWSLNDPSSILGSKFNAGVSLCKYVKQYY